MTEHQNIEYKQSWRDEHLKWVCGFANANGGIIYIGKNDDGKVVGVRGHKKLMEDIPNKIHDILGVMTEVNLKKSRTLYFIEIVVAPYSVPISYRGRYYYRTGSIKRELTGSALIEGNLIYCLQEAIELLDHKFLISPVSFEGIHRIEKWQYPLPALREVLLNALIHKNYMGAHVQIEVYDDKICFWNGGGLPEELTIQLLKKKHASYPRNPLIAGVCFKGGYIDAWGRGIEKILNACREDGFPEPEFEENSGGMLVTLFARKSSEAQADKATQQAGTKLGLSRDQVEILRNCSEDKGITDLMDVLKRSNRTKFRNQVLNPLIEENLVEMTIPNKPTSSRQKYRLTEKGKLFLG